MFIIADAHVSEAYNNHQDFFNMLDELEATGEDIVFLGDIFDLWVSLPRYEGPVHHRFLDWCRAYKQKAVVGFIEGNHEFYMVARHRDCFTWSDGARRREAGLLFVHGDLINRADKNYLRWRKLSKNGLMRTLVRFLPGGPKRVHDLKLKMKKTNQDFRLGLPEQALTTFARRHFAKGIERILVGHFHEEWTYTEGTQMLHVLPDWHSTGAVGFLDRNKGELVTGHWSKLSSRREGRTSS